MIVRFVSQTQLYQRLLRGKPAGSSACRTALDFGNKDKRHAGLSTQFDHLRSENFRARGGQLADLSQRVNKLHLVERLATYPLGL